MFCQSLGLTLLLALTGMVEGFTIIPKTRTHAVRLPVSQLTIRSLRSAAHVNPCFSREVRSYAAPGSDSPSDEGAELPAVKTVAGLVVAGTLVALAAAAGGIWINSFSTVPCQLNPEGCQQIPLFMKLPLVATHLFSFLLIPATMFTFWTRAKELEAAGAKDPLTAQIGISFLMVAIAGEIGWHVTQEWFYVEDYSILNFMFYFFLNLGSALWAVGIREEKKELDAPSFVNLSEDAEDKLDKALLAAPVLSGAFYLAGASVLHTKVPIYILLAFVYTVLTQRFWKLLDTAWVLLFPAFSVGANLFFISLLDKYKADHVLNPLFHILHDAAGTELGIVIITAMTYYRLQESRAAKQQL